MKVLIIAGPYEADRVRRAVVSAGFEAVAVEPGESLSGWITASRPDLIAELQAALALLGEQRIAEDDVRPPELIAQPLELVDDVGDRPGTVTGQDPVRAIRAEFRAPPARQQREAAADRPR